MQLSGRRGKVLIWTAVAMVVVVVGWLATLKFQLAKGQDDDRWKEILAPLKDLKAKENWEQIKQELRESSANVSSSTSTLEWATSTEEKIN